MDELTQDNTLQAQQDRSRRSAGNLLDQIMRKLSMLSLNDYFLGAYINYPNSKVEVFFSDRVPIDLLNELKNNVQSADFQVQIDETDQEGAKFVLRAALAGSDGPAEVPTAGTVGFDVDLTGMMDVT
jgi:hypothetical protein